LDHPNVVRAFDADQIGDLLYIVMEYVPGRSFDHVVAERGSLSPSEVVNYMAQAALGLEPAFEPGGPGQGSRPRPQRLDGGGQGGVVCDSRRPRCRHGPLHVTRTMRRDRDRLPERSLQPRLHDVLPADLPATFPRRYTGGMSCTTNPGLSDSDHEPPLGSVPAISRSAGSIPG